MTTFESLDELLKTLPNSSNRKLTLTDIHTMLSNLPPSILTCYAPNLSYDELFRLLETADKDELETTCNVLDKLLNSVDAAYLMSNFAFQVDLGLHHNSLFVIYLCLEQLERVAKDGVGHFEGHHKTVASIVNLISSDNTSIAMKASNILTYFGVSEESLAIVFCDEMLQKFLAVAVKSDIVRFRVYEAIIAIVAQNDTALIYFLQHSTQETNFLEHLLAETFPQSDKTDLLAQLNAIEILSKLALSQHGYHFLESSKVDSKLESLMLESSNCPSNRLLLPGLIKVFGSICKNFPKFINTRYTTFVTIVFDNIIQYNPSLLGICVETLGVMGSSVEGKIALSRMGPSTLSSLSVLSDLVGRSPTELKVATLNAIKQLLRLSLEEQLPDVLRVVEKWFMVLFEKNAVSEIQSICMQPYMELKLSGFAALNSVASLKIGQKALRACAGFQEYLLNRRTDTSNEGIHAKFKVICTLASSPHTESVFGAPFKAKLMEYEKKGSVYVASSTFAVADASN